MRLEECDRGQQHSILLGARLDIVSTIVLSQDTDYLLAGDRTDLLIDERAVVGDGDFEA